MIVLHEKATLSFLWLFHSAFFSSKKWRVSITTLITLYVSYRWFVTPATFRILFGISSISEDCNNRLCYCRVKSYITWMQVYTRVALAQVLMQYLTMQEHVWLHLVENKLYTFLKVRFLAAQWFEIVYWPHWPLRHVTIIFVSRILKVQGMVKVAEAQPRTFFAISSTWKFLYTSWYIHK